MTKRPCATRAQRIEKMKNQTAKQNTSAQTFCSRTKDVPTDSLKAHPKNPNQHKADQVALLAKIIEAQGFRNPIVVSERSGFIVAGHARLAAAQKLGLESVPVDVQKFETEEAELAHLLADNRIAELAEINDDTLKDVLSELSTSDIDMDLTGFDSAAIDEILGQIQVEDEIDAEPQIDRAKELAEKWGTKDGQLWELGDHRLVCGCSRLKTTTEALMSGALADMVLTDPPYGVAYVGKTKDALKIQNDNVDEKTLAGMCKDWFDRAEEVSRDGAYWVATVPPGPLHGVFFLDWKKRGILRQVMVWNKDSMVLGHSEYHYKHEPILFGWKAGERLKNSDRTKTTVWDFPRPKKSREHPTMKPVEMWCYAIQNHTRPKDAVYEPFSGSGTTIIACERLGRKCRAIEIDPNYVAVAIERWHEATGKEPKLIG